MRKGASPDRLGPHYEGNARGFNVARKLLYKVHAGNQRFLKTLLMYSKVDYATESSGNTRQSPAICT